MTVNEDWDAFKDGGIQVSSVIAKKSNRRNISLWMNTQSCLSCDGWWEKTCGEMFMWKHTLTQAYTLLALTLLKLKICTIFKYCIYRNKHVIVCHTCSDLLSTAWNELKQKQTKATMKRSDHRWACSTVHIPGLTLGNLWGTDLWFCMIQLSDLTWDTMFDIIAGRSSQHTISFQTNSVFSKRLNIFILLQHTTI